METCGASKGHAARTRLMAKSGHGGMGSGAGLANICPGSLGLRVVAYSGCSGGSTEGEIGRECQFQASLDEARRSFAETQVPGPVRDWVACAALPGLPGRLSDCFPPFSPKARAPRPQRSGLPEDRGVTAPGQRMEDLARVRSTMGAKGDEGLRCR
jgi:hypothetical protein